jgi:hypothetical protein
MFLYFGVIMFIVLNDGLLTCQIYQPVHQLLRQCGFTLEDGCFNLAGFISLLDIDVWHLLIPLTQLTDNDKRALENSGTLFNPENTDNVIQLLIDHIRIILLFDLFSFWKLFKLL